MNAAVCHALGAPLVVEDVILDPPQRGEVRVRIAAVAICHSDVHLVRGDWAGWSAGPPVIAGHEAAGVVVELGGGVTRLRVGDPVVVSLIRWCGTCARCAGGAPYLCEASFPLATEHRLHARDGRALNAGIRTAAFAEEVVVHESQATPVPDDLPLDRACLLACGVITGVGAVANTARVGPGASVAVIGTGGVGLNAVQGAALVGAAPLIALDVTERKLEAARAFGATHALHAERDDVGAAVRRLTAGRGADYVFVTVGSPAAATQALGLARRGGTVVLVGMPATGAAVSVPVGDFASNALRLLGCNMGSTDPRADIPRLAALYRAGRLRLDELISGRYPLGGINEAIESMERGEALRHVVVFPPARATP